MGERIPDDVWETAKDFFQRYCHFTMHMTLDSAEGSAKRAIAEAILAERERCAKIADDIEADACARRLSYAQSIPERCGYLLHEEYAARKVARAIRGES